MMIRFRHKNRTGFTLIEVMIALAILGFITTIIWTSFGRMLESRDYVERIQERFHGVRTALNRMQREISMAYLSRHVSGDRRTATIFKATREGHGYRLVFTNVAGMKMYEDANTTDSNVIHYYLDSDQDDPGQMNLMRKQTRRLVEDPEIEDTDIPAYVLAENIEGMEMQFFDVQQNEWADEWDTSGVEKANRLPTRVKITLISIDEQGREQKFTTQTRIWLFSALSFGYR